MCISRIDSFHRQPVLRLEEIKTPVLRQSCIQALSHHHVQLKIQHFPWFFPPFCCCCSPNRILELSGVFAVVVDGKEQHQPGLLKKGSRNDCSDGPGVWQLRARLWTMAIMVILLWAWGAPPPPLPPSTQEGAMDGENRIILNVGGIR